MDKISIELKKVQTAVENASDIIFITDCLGKTIYINKAVKSMMGYTQEEMLGRKPNFWIEGTSNKFFKEMWYCISGKKSFVGQFQDKKKNGDIFMAEIKISPVLDKNKKIISFVGIERDITETKKIEQAKIEFLSLASHQLRTPIASIGLTAEILFEDLKGKINKESRFYLGEIVSGVKKMSQMIEMFLNVSKIEMKAFEVNPRPQNIARIINENLKFAELSYKNKGQKLIKKIMPNLPIVNVDEKILNIALENLISNAIKYTRAKGTIKVTAEKCKRNILICVEDTGYGIPKDKQHKIFEKLFRLEKTSDEVEGVGLGLYLTKSLIEQSGGKIWVKSEENKGSKFYISFPISGMKKITKR